MELRDRSLCSLLRFNLSLLLSSSNFGLALLFCFLKRSLTFCLFVSAVRYIHAGVSKLLFQLSAAGSAFLKRGKDKFRNEHDGVAHGQFPVEFLKVAALVGNHLEFGRILAATLVVLFVVVDVNLVLSSRGRAVFPKDVLNGLARLSAHVGVDVQFTTAG